MSGFEVLLWLYLANSVLLIIHEIDSAYWQEWDLFKLPGGITGFLVIHVPLIFLVLYGLVSVFQQSYIGLLFSSFLSASGIFAFVVHAIFLKKGRKEFKTSTSIILLILILLISLSQSTLTYYVFSA